MALRRREIWVCRCEYCGAVLSGEQLNGRIASVFVSQFTGVETRICEPDYYLSMGQILVHYRRCGQFDFCINGDFVVH